MSVTDQSYSHKIVNELKKYGVDAFIANMGKGQLFLMNNIPLIIMAAGASSRMKASDYSTNLSEDQVSQSNSRAGFIKINEKNETLIYHIIKN